MMKEFMRIIAGSKRGKKLFEKVDTVTRPTTDRVRENVFNVLAGLVDLRGARVLDLFAGCGSYGLESYSRGAAEIVFCDADKAACEVIKQNCKAIGLVIPSPTCIQGRGISGTHKATLCYGGVVLNLDYKLALEKLKSQKFDVIFLDPPYQSDFALQSLKLIQKQNMLSENGIIVIESEQELDLPFVKSKKYGRARVYFLAFDA